MEYLAVLKKIAMNYEFESNLEEMLRDQIVWRVKDNIITNKLLAKANLTYNEAIEIATAMKIAQTDLVELSQGTLK